MKLSNYSRIYHIDQEYYLFNTINKAIVKLEEKYIDDQELCSDFPEEYRKPLDDMGFFICDSEAESMVREILEKDRKLMISVEVGLSCNMRCPYCYQGTDKIGKSVLSGENISDLICYFEIIQNKWQYDEVVLKVLGGEPTTLWNVAERVIGATYEFCKKNKKKLNLMIDTNGVMIDPILQLSNYDSLLLTIPLTYRECHNKMRKLVNGEGSYDRIIANLNLIYKKDPGIKIVLRHNTDDENINKFSDYVIDLKKELSFVPVIDLSYTTELCNDHYNNPLKYENYLKWKCTEAIDILAENDYYIMASPLRSVDRCQYRSRYSLKLFSDGTVGGCAMDFFLKDRMPIKKLCDDCDAMAVIKKQRESEYESCVSCRSFFLCGGGYKLPCIQSLPIPRCSKDGAYITDIRSFLGKYLYYRNQGKADLFAGFNNNIAIR